MSQSTDNAEFLQDYTATFFPRLGAYLVDLIIVGAAICFLVSPLWILGAVFPDFILFQNVFFCYTLADVAGYLVYKAYFLLLMGITGTTIGKSLFHLSIVDREGGKPKFLQLLLRETVGRFLGSILFWGYIMSFIDKEHRAFHDYMADTSVICSQKMKLVKRQPKKEGTAPAAAVAGTVAANAENGKKGLVKHVILWKLKDSLTPEEKETVKQEIKKGLEGLKGQIPGLVNIRVNTEGLETSNADLMLDSVFTDKEALKGYAVHPLHVAVADGVVRPNTAERVCLDYEI